MRYSLQLALDLLDRTFRSKPLLFVSFAWMIGIGLADRWAVTPGIAGAAGLMMGMAALAVRCRWGSLLLVLAGVAGLAVAATRLALTPPRDDVSAWNGRQVAVAGTVDTVPVDRCDHWRCLMSCTAVTGAGKPSAARGKLYVRGGPELGRLEPGDALVVYGLLEAPSPARNPGGFSLACWLARRGVFATLSARPGAVVPLHTGSWNWQRSAESLRHRVADANRKVMADAQAATLVNSMLFGDRDSGDPESWGATEERFRRAGVIHVLVVSGAQVALLFGLLWVWRRWALKPRHGPLPLYARALRATAAYSPRQAFGAGLVLLAVYVPLVGFQPSILRPALVVVIWCIGRWLQRETDPENTLAAAALLLLVVNPLTLYDLGFQRSFAAVWGILRWTAPLASIMGVKLEQRDSWLFSEAAEEPVPGPARRARPNIVVRILAMTLAAQLAITPLVARQFQTLSIIAPASNLPAILLTTALLPVGLISSALCTLLLATRAVPWPLLHAISWPTEQLAWLLDAVVTVFARPHWATIPVSPPCWSEIAIIAGLLLVASTPALVSRRPLSFGLLAVAGAVMAVAVFRPALPVRAPTLTFIDVGQGDGCLIRLPGGFHVLVDGGGSPRAPCEQRDCSDAAVGHLADWIRTDCPDVGRDTLANYLRYERVGRIDLMVLTHPHDDHLWGLDALLDPRQGFTVRGVLDAGQPYATPANREWLKLLEQNHITPINARRGMELMVGPARLVVLHPPPGGFLSHTRNDPNNNSIVLRLEVGGSRVLLTGDAESEAEASMAGQDVEAAVLT